MEIDKDKLRIEAGDFIKNNHPDPDSLFTGNKKFDDALYQNILALMANFAHSKMAEPLNDKEKKELSEWLVYRGNKELDCYIHPREGRQLIEMLKPYEPKPVKSNSPTAHIIQAAIKEVQKDIHVPKVLRDGTIKKKK